MKIVAAAPTNAQGGPGRSLGTPGGSLRGSLGGSLGRSLGGSLRGSLGGYLGGSRIRRDANAVVK